MLESYRQTLRNAIRQIARGIGVFNDTLVPFATPVKKALLERNSKKSYSQSSSQDKTL